MLNKAALNVGYWIGPLNRDQNWVWVLSALGSLSNPPFRSHPLELYCLSHYETRNTDNPLSHPQPLPKLSLTPLRISVACGRNMDRRLNGRCKKTNEHNGPKHPLTLQADWTTYGHEISSLSDLKVPSSSQKGPPMGPMWINAISPLFQHIQK